jgi:hypothetical protein
MTANEVIAAVLERDIQMLAWTLGDFSDADLLARPVPGANHTAWQLGHLTVAEQHAGNAVKPGSMPELPAGFADRFAKDKARSDNPADFPSKAELIAQFERVRRGTVAWARSMTPQDYAAPTPEKMQGWAPTVGQLALALSGHVAMHLGQIQVIRRKLGKPILF